MKKMKRSDLPARLAAKRAGKAGIRLGRIIAVVGPTASGKTELAINLAKKYGGEIICADSRTVYRKLDLGTAKPTKRQQRQIPHHMLDVAETGETFSAGRFKKLADRAINEIQSQDKIPVIVGGSGFYIDALVYDLSIPPVPPNWSLRIKLEKKSTGKLLDKLKKLDPKAYSRIDKKNRRRIIRAIEVCRTGFKFSDFYKEKILPDNILLIGIDLPRRILYKRIDDRVDERINQGMIREVEDLVKKDKVDTRWLKNLGLEYKFLTMYVLGELTKNEAVQKLKYAIHDFARRQATWFRRDKNIKWVKNQEEAENLIKKYLKSR